MRSLEEIGRIEKKLQEQLPDKLLGILTKLNRKNKLDEFLELLDIDVSEKNAYRPVRNGKILVFGDSGCSKEVLEMVARKEGFDNSRFEYHLDYYDAEKYNFRQLQYNIEYTAVLFGPVPHSGTIKGNYGSIISALEQEPGYPYVIRLGNSSLKISKSSYKAGLKKLDELLKIA